MKNILTLILISLSLYAANAQSPSMNIWWGGQAVWSCNIGGYGIDSITFTNPPPTIVINFLNSQIPTYTRQLALIDSITYDIPQPIVSNPGAGVTFNGYTYQTIILGNGQEWMAENLRTAIYRNGDTIPNVTVTNQYQWTSLTIGAWCHYNNDNLYENPYGKLYNWNAVTDSRNVCPAGWHVPTDGEWNTLAVYLNPGSSGKAGGRMKSTGTQYWQSPNIGATNESGFSGLPGGCIGSSGFGNLGIWGEWWSSTLTGTGYPYFFAVSKSSVSLTRQESYALHLPNSTWAFSVRCIKN